LVSREVPGQQFIDAVDGVIGDAREHVAQVPNASCAKSAEETELGTDRRTARRYRFRQCWSRVSTRGKSLMAQDELPDLLRNSDYHGLLADVSGLLEQARRGSSRAVNAIMTATYWEIGRLIVERE
jgi:hypothetical protein